MNDDQDPSMPSKFSSGENEIGLDVLVEGEFRGSILLPSTCDMHNANKAFGSRSIRSGEEGILSYDRARLLSTQI